MQTITKPILKSFFDLHGQMIEICCDDAAIDRQVQSLLNYFGMTPLDHRPRTISASLHFKTREQLPGLPKTAEKAGHYNSLTLWRAGDEIFVKNEQAVFQLNMTTLQATGFLSAPLWRNLDALRQPHIDIIINSLLSLLRYRGFFALHAACLVNCGRGFLLVGESGSGKSTLTLALLEQGWRYLSDDSVLLRPTADGRVDALAMRQRLYVLPDTAQQFEKIAAYWRDCALSNGVKQFIQPEQIYTGQFKSHCMPKTIIFPKIVDEPRSRLVPVTEKSAGYRHLVNQSTLFAYDTQMTPRHLEILKMLLSQTRQYQLFAGRDLKENPGLIEQYLLKIADCPDNNTLPANPRAVAF